MLDLSEIESLVSTLYNTDLSIRDGLKRVGLIGFDKREVQDVLLREGLEQCKECGAWKWSHELRRGRCC